ncbi:hypothetical protein B0J12DRAFT_429029 [Macrophomina phaseolina]|uniref:Secreted protein n=1 Tax=Macrophomina phaseolina TaxID=35725 RepID=A0ABQ8GGZ7_9PEZI|nr:hypothetical protein B0J12DRAFT_429029 [Macrophomina phaseolina]
MAWCWDGAGWEEAGSLLIALLLLLLLRPLRRCSDTGRCSCCCLCLSLPLSASASLCLCLSLPLPLSASASLCLCLCRCLFVNHLHAPEPPSLRDTPPTRWPRAKHD